MKDYSVTIGKDIDIDVSKAFDEMDEGDRKDFILDKFVEVDEPEEFISDFWDRLSISEQNDAMENFVDSLTDSQRDKLLDYLGASV